MPLVLWVALALLVAGAHGQTLYSPAGGLLLCSSNTLNVSYNIPGGPNSNSVQSTLTPTSGFASGTAYTFQFSTNFATATRLVNLASVVVAGVSMISPSGATQIPNNNYTFSLTYVPSGGTEGDRTLLATVAPILVMYQSSANPNITSPVEGTAYGGPAGIPVIFNANRILRSGNITLNGQSQALQIDRVFHNFTILPANALHPTTSGNYTLNITYVDGCDNTTVLTGSVIVTLDMETAEPILTKPVTSDPIALTPLQANVSYRLPEQASTASVLLTFEGASFTAIYHLSNTSGTDVSLLEDFLFAQPDNCTPCLSAAPQGLYNVTLSYQDYLGNTASSVMVYDVMVDQETLAPTLLSPDSGYLGYDQFNVSYTLPEAASVVKLWIVGDETLVLTLDPSLLEASFVFDNSALTASPSGVVLDVNGTSLPTGCYTMHLAYQDAYENPSTSSASVDVVLDTTPACEDGPTTPCVNTTRNVTIIIGGGVIIRFVNDTVYINNTVYVNDTIYITVETTTQVREIDWAVTGPVIGVASAVFLLAVGWYAWSWRPQYHRLY